MKNTLSIFGGLVVMLAALFSPLPASAQMPKITDISLASDLASYFGRPCPAEITLKAYIKANGPLGVVTYQFIHSDGTLSEVSNLKINSSGTFTVEESLPKTSGNWVNTVLLRVTTTSGTRFESNRLNIKGECPMVRAVQPPAVISLPAAAGRFRVTLNGFTCNRPTADPNLGDGADDEVLLFTKSFLVEKRAGSREINVAGPYRHRTQVIGDTAGIQSFRIQGGSSRILGANGGFRGGDSFPSSPNRPSTNPRGNALPQLIWEGDLERGQNAMVIIPMIWEWDGQPGLFDAWESAGLSRFFDVGNLISNPSQTDQERAKIALSGEVGGQVWINGNPQDRPVGMRVADRDFRFRPQILILTYDEALRMARLSESKNGEAFPIIYKDADELGGGEYTLYLQIEMLTR